MPKYLTAYLATAVVFFGLDFLWLRLAAGRFYRVELGELLRHKPNLPVAALFYLVYVGGAVVFAVAPAIDAGSWVTALLLGALLGLIAYGTYDFTNLAIPRVARDGHDRRSSLGDRCDGDFGEPGLSDRKKTGWLMMTGIARLHAPARRVGGHMSPTRLLALLGLALGLLVSPLAQAGATRPDPVVLYGGRLVFDIVRDGDTIGSQTLSFQKQNDDLTVNIVTDIDVRLLFVTVYRYRYEATTHWHGGRVQEMTATTNDDGKLSKVTARVDGRGTAIEGPAGRFQSPTSVFPGEHWNLEEIRQSALLNSITGKLDRITVADQGPETIPALDGKRAARRYAYSGDLKLTIWYDANGRWVGLRFLARDGSTIDYVCRQCGPANKSPPAG